MIPISISQKQIVLDFFAEDIKIVKKYFNAIGFDFDEEFNFDVFKEFIYSAAGMFKDIDPTIYKEDLIKQFNMIQKFKSYTCIKGLINLYKYVKYYLGNVAPKVPIQSIKRNNYKQNTIVGR